MPEPSAASSDLMGQIRGRGALEVESWKGTLGWSVYRVEPMEAGIWHLCVDVLEFQLMSLYIGAEI